MSDFDTGANVRLAGKSRKLFKYEIVTLATIFGGYVGMYLNEVESINPSNVVISILFWQGAYLVGAAFVGERRYWIYRVRYVDLTGIGILTNSEFGVILSISSVAYFLSKFVCGSVITVLGGKWSFLLGLTGSALLTFMGSTVSKAWLIGITFIISRLFQSFGWGAIIAVISRWFPVHVYGRIVALMSLSYQGGEVFARFALGLILVMTGSWRLVFVTASTAMTCAAILVLSFLKSSPHDIGEKEPHERGEDDDHSTIARSSHESKGKGKYNIMDENPAGLDENSAVGTEQPPENVSVVNEDNTFSQRDMFLSLCKNPSFWLAVGLSFILTAIRATFSMWTPTFIVSQLKVSPGEAAMCSMLFPLVASVASLTAGFSIDKAGPGRFGLVMIPFLALSTLSTCCLFFSTLAPTDEPPFSTVCATIALLGVAGFGVMGPYTFLDGALSLLIGGTRGSALVANLVAAGGSLGEAFSGYIIGLLSEKLGWAAVFFALTIMGVMAILGAVLLQCSGRVRSRDKPDVGAPVEGDNEVVIENEGARLKSEDAEP